MPREVIAMMFKVQCQDRRWRVVPPDLTPPTDFACGAVAFDFANALAREHHAQTGTSSAVRVEVQDAFVDAVRYG
jgi:hypothetical protein